MFSFGGLPYSEPKPLHDENKFAFGFGAPSFRGSFGGVPYSESEPIDDENKFAFSQFRTPSFANAFGAPSTESARLSAREPRPFSHVYGPSERKREAPFSAFGAPSTLSEPQDYGHPLALEWQGPQIKSRNVGALSSFRGRRNVHVPASWFVYGKPLAGPFQTEEEAQDSAQSFHDDDVAAAHRHEHWERR